MAANMKSGTLKILVGALLIAGAAGFFGLLAFSPGKFQRDFATYYYASLAYSRGLNPYDTAPQGIPEHLMFVYPPHVLPLFGWAPALAYPDARLAWLLLKGVFLAALLLAWRKMLKPPDLFFYAFAALAFNAAILIDLSTGNVAIVEQAFLWGGFLALADDRPLVFALLVAASAVFKVTNGLFLLLLLFLPPRKGALPFASGILAIGAPLAISFAGWPRLFESFLANGRVLLWPGERGSSNPCLWACLADTRDLIGSHTGWTLPDSAVKLLFALHAVAVLAVTARLILNLTRSGIPNRRILAVSLACLAYPLVVPRFKDYSFIQLIPPAYILLRGAGTRRIESALFVFILCMPSVTEFRFLEPLAEYHLLFVVWSGYPCWCTSHGYRTPGGARRTDVISA